MVVSAPTVASKPASATSSELAPTIIAAPSRSAMLSNRAPIRSEMENAPTLRRKGPLTNAAQATPATRPVNTPAPE